MKQQCNVSLSELQFSHSLSPFIARIFIFLLNSFVEGLNAVLVHFGLYYTARFVHCSTSELLFSAF